MATYESAEDFYYTQLRIEKKKEGYDEKKPSEALKKAVEAWVNSCTTVTQADNVFYTARKHEHYLSEANEKKHALQNAKDQKWEKSSANPKNIIKSIFG